MLSVNTHEAKTKLSSLLLAVEKKNEVVIICRNGIPVAELHAVKHKPAQGLPPVAKNLMPTMLYDPTEPATDDEWPDL